MFRESPSTGVQLMDYSQESSLEAWLSPPMIPGYIVMASILTLMLQLRQWPTSLLWSLTTFPKRDTLSGLAVSRRENAALRLALQRGGLTAFSFMVARLLGCLVFLGLSIATFCMQTRRNGQDRTGIQPGNASKDLTVWGGIDNTSQLVLGLTALYASLLASLSLLTSSKSWSQRTSTHLSVIAFATFLVFAYRDLWPLMTFTKTPQDIREGWLVWAKLLTLALVGIIFPLTSPRQYTSLDLTQGPVDATAADHGVDGPVVEVHPEQTASWLSLLLYSWLDRTVFLAYRSSHLSRDQLPQLADYDRAKNLVKKGFPLIDTFSGSKKRHIFFGLMEIYRKEYATMAALVVLQVLLTLTSPLAVNRLLDHMEGGREGAVVRPWVWAALLFIGPTMHSISFQWYTSIGARIAVHTEGILTQLIFEHALRIRVKAGAQNPGVSEGDSHSSDDSAGDASSTEPGDVGSRTDLSSSAKRNVEADRTPPSSVNFTGRINNLITTDMSNITDSKDFLSAAIEIPLQISLCTCFLYYILGFSALVGLLVMLILFPLPGYVANRFQGIQVEQMKKTDARVQSVTESMHILRMIKLFGWENKIGARVAEKRDEELLWTRRRQLLQLLSNMINFVIPIAVMLTTYTTFTIFMKQELSASLVFSSMAIFDILQSQLHVVSWSIPRILQGRVALDRVNDFLRNSELLDTLAAQGGATDVEELDIIGFRHATFAWSEEDTGLIAPSRRSFHLQIDNEVVFQQGRINLVVGPTGSGKTSMLLALLGEMHFIPSRPNSWFGLPRKKGIAYAAQESWVQNETIRDNIVFGAPFDEARYNKVLYQCGLERDLALFEARDLTEVGEKGLTLSGGQKARVTLARAIYSSAQILLLDDVLAALDVHTAKWVIDKCFCGELVRGRTIIMATHSLAMTSGVAHFVVTLNSNGVVIGQGALFDATTQIDDLIAEVGEVRKEAEQAQAQDTKQEVTPDGKLVSVEELVEGHVDWSALKLYLVGWGGGHPAIYWVLFLVGMTMTHLSKAAQPWYLGYWARQYEGHTSTVDVSYYVTIYSSILISTVVLYSFSYTVNLFGMLRASRSIHKNLVGSIFGTTLRWLDTTPTARIIARCTQDINSVDGPFALGLSSLIELTITMMIKLGAVVLLSPSFLLPGILVAVVGGWCGQIYMKAELSVKRELSNAKAPVLGHLGAAITGLVSIRAYGAQEAFKVGSLARIDRYTQAARAFYSLNCWVSVRLEALGALFSAGLAAYLIYGQSTMEASDVGFSLNMAVTFSAMVLWWIIIFNDVEINGNSLERIAGYMAIEQEPKAIESGRPPAYWPASGDLRVENLSARYSSTGPMILRGLSFHIRSGERIGIVGRTGSGKSSLSLALLRSILTEGDVYFDGIHTSSLNLDALRSNITIIPQIPELLSGTLRQNIDPFDQCDDATLNDALRSAGLFAAQMDSDRGKLTLDSDISGGGGNLSVGQRQILAIARAMLRGSKLLILDEATSAIDHKTDSVIQSSLRTGLHDVTQIIVAHRLQTVIDADKIMVLDAGQIVEFASPKELLEDDQGFLRALVDASEDKDMLFSIAKQSK
ncbi:P-loop containing nucleoside triphosphate hydrolase protein [Leucogyrophana mollusca]|uniref:P-loop containing nucleoside triphosphate hydrolase protein n=1 Tax=Leucogyrophana mollusca TaxID=85980 RepID=A0ACB8C0N8_9AGAM|nr:P-loop containing nucleoside triphosphate hydrolase protein [Leucogyrophana mollusca]